MVDQVTYSFDVKMSKDYNSGGVSVAYTTDVRIGEDANEAYQRAVDFVEDKVAEKMDDLKEIYG